jgi:hypothetical protein
LIFIRAFLLIDLSTSIALGLSVHSRSWRSAAAAVASARSRLSPEIVADQPFEITREHEDGSPAGHPTGPVSFKGNAARAL